MIKIEKYTCEHEWGEAEVTYDVDPNLIGTKVICCLKCGTPKVNYVGKDLDEFVGDPILTCEFQGGGIAR